jgi:hypothetical protein
MRNYKLDESLLPEVWLTWESKSGSVYMNGKNGKRQRHPENWMCTEEDIYNQSTKGKISCGCYWENRNEPRIWAKSGSNLIFAYAKYHADIKRLELAAVKYDTTRGEYAHEWKFAGRRFFIDKDKSCLLEDGSVYTQGYKDLFQHYSVWNVRQMLQMLTRQHSNDNFTKEFRKFIGANYFTIGNGNVVDIEYSYHVQKWYETVQKTRSAGKAQKLTDKLIEMPLCNIDGFGEKYPIKKNESSKYYNMKDVIYFEKVNDDWCVLRSLHRNEDNELNETWRVYIGKDGATRIVSKNKNGWVPSKQPLHNRYGANYAYIANMDEAISQCPRIKYIMSSKKIEKEYQISDFLITSLRFPEIEQLCKLGFGNSVETITRSYTPKADIKDLFGGYYNEKEKSLLRKVGMTKPQLDVYIKHSGEDKSYISYEHRGSLSELRSMFGNDLTYLDVNSFEKYLIACKEWRKFKHWNGSLIMDNAGLNLDNMRFFKNLVRLMNKRYDIFTVVYDAINAYRSLRNDRRLDIDWYFDDVSDAIRAHDALIELERIQREEDRARYNMQEAERRKKEEEKRKKLDKERQVYEYEDADFIIRLPKDANEIVQEGATQHICIGGYVSRHSMGDTNLFFLRSKSDPDKPFYAIEMNNGLTIQQIHGFGNRWLGNNPEVIPTVIRWLRKHGIKCNNEILTCKATGYGMSKEFVPMPVVD